MEAEAVEDRALFQRPLNLTTAAPLAILSREEPPQYGGRSSMAEHLTVDQDVAGSSPVGHPTIFLIEKQ